MFSKKMLKLVLLLTGLLVSHAFAGEEAKKEAPKVDAVKVKAEAKAVAKIEVKAEYPLDTCVVSGEKLGSMGDAIKYDHKGQEVQFCCKKCVSKFEAEPAKFLAKIDEAKLQKQLAAYPLETCVVSGEKLGAEGDKPVDYMHDGKLVRFCCKDCKKKFENDPAKYMATLDKAHEKAKAKVGEKVEKVKDAPKTDSHEGHNH